MKLFDDSEMGGEGHAVVWPCAYPSPYAHWQVCLEVSWRP